MSKSTKKKNLCLMAPIAALTGNYSAVDNDGHEQTLRFREFGPSGKKYFGIGTPKRNYDLHPVTEDETAQRELFSQSAALRKKIVKDQALKATWLTRFQADTKSGATECTTLGGYIMSQALHGHVDAQGQYQE